MKTAKTVNFLSGGGSTALSALFFPCAALYHELLLRAFDRDSAFLSPALLRIFLFSVAAGLAVYLICDLIPKKTVSRLLAGAVMFLFIVVLCVERGIKGMFSMYYGVLAAADAAGAVAGDFAGNTALAIRNTIPFILLALIPFAAFIVFRKTILPEKERPSPWRARLVALAALILCQVGGVLLSGHGETAALYTYDFTTNNAIPEFGLATGVRLELQYAVFGMPEADIGQFIENNDGTATAGNTGGSGGTPDNGAAPGDSETPGENADPNEANAPDAGDTGDGSTGNAGDTGNAGGSGESGGDAATGGAEEGGEDEPPAPVEYGCNVLDIDFDALAAESSGTIADMHRYFGSLTPSKQNEYTGLFKGKNMILICAESFCSYAVDPDLTPTLYRMTREEGFVFTNFYQPDWTLSTCGGEFSVLTGIIPNWFGHSDSSRQAIGKDMSVTLGNLFKTQGYSTRAWHNGEYTFYNRDQYLPVFGYDYKAEGGGGLDLPTDRWPRSDCEMIEYTCDEYINEYLETGVPFHTFYMTITGHGPWAFYSSERAKGYQAQVQEKYPDLDRACQAYLASNMDLDRALELLVRKLTDAGIVDDTLIVMCADHYPYFLASGNSQEGSFDYYNVMNEYFGNPTDSEGLTTRYRNTLLMWSGSLEKTVIDAPCYSCDIVPTVANLFGLPYDSRLYTGRDILDPDYDPAAYSSSMPLVIFVSNKGQGNSWITAAGTYEASTHTFTPNEGVTVAEDYVEKVTNLVNGKLQNSKLVISQNYFATIYGGSSE